MSTVNVNLNMLILYQGQVIFSYNISQFLFCQITVFLKNENFVLPHKRTS